MFTLRRELVVGANQLESLMKFLPELLAEFIVGYAVVLRYRL